MSESAQARAQSPPDPCLRVVYHEIASGDGEHVAAIETIATRYRHTPTRGAGGGIGEAIGRFGDRLSTDPYAEFTKPSH